MDEFDRITTDPEVMGGKPCIRGIRITVATLVEFLATGATKSDLFRMYPFLEEQDIRQAVKYAAVRQ